MASISSEPTARARRRWRFAWSMPSRPTSARCRLARRPPTWRRHNVHRGRMDVWTGFYKKLFNFRQIRFFDIEGRASGLFSRALTSPDGKIRIPINEDAGDAGQIEEYLNVYRGEGIQHIACG